MDWTCVAACLAVPFPSPHSWADVAGKPLLPTARKKRGENQSRKRRLFFRGGPRPPKEGGQKKPGVEKARVGRRRRTIEFALTRQEKRGGRGKA